MPTETSTGRSANLGVELGMPLPEGQKPKVTREADRGLTAQFDQGGMTVEAANPDAPTAAEAGGDGTQTGGEQQPDAETPEATGAPEALPEFDAEKPEAVEAYTKAYVKEDGSLNQENLSAAWMKNAQVDPKTGAISGSLTEGDYAFLATKGISKEMAKSVEAGQVARLTMDRQAVFAKAGGAEKYEAAREWARKGGYNADAQAKFNTDLNAGGALRDDAIDLLMQRYGRANPAPRRKSPEVSAAEAGNPAGSGGNGGASQGYADYAAYQAAFRASQRGERGAEPIATVRAKLRASPWYGKK
jgi:hypothetical protein